MADSVCSRTSAQNPTNTHSASLIALCLRPEGAKFNGNRIERAQEAGCWRRFKIEPPCRLNFEPGLMANL